MGLQSRLERIEKDADAPPSKTQKVKRKHSGDTAEDKAERSSKKSKKLENADQAANDENDDDEDMVVEQKTIHGERGAKEEEPRARKAKEVDAEVEDDVDKRVFVGGLPYTCDEAVVRDLFIQCGKIFKIEMPGGGGGAARKGRCRGIAFITFKKRKGAAAALELDGSDYESKSLKVQMASSSGDKKGSKNGTDVKGGKVGKDAEQKDDRKGQVRVVVSNLPKECTKNALKLVFAKCGDMIELSMPTSKDGKHTKGVAFVKYRTKAGALAACKFNGDDYAGRKLNVSIVKPHQASKADKAAKKKSKRPKQVSRDKPASESNAKGSAEKSKAQREAPK